MAPRRRRSGNLLLSALFMAAFLFFLSVALVLTNREDIQYTLFVDHKMRCSLAADGSLDYGLQTMRTNTAWEDRFKSWVLPFNSGAEGRLQYRSWVDPQGIPGADRFSVPLASSPSAGVELIATGSSGLFRSERHMLLEEFRLADSLLSKGGSKPHLFVMSDAGQVQVLTPSFSWEKAGDVLAKPLMGSVSAGGGPLVHCALNAGTQPPVIKDFTPPNLSQLPAYTPGFGVSPTQIPKGQGAFVLELKDNNFNWVQLPDPGDQLVKPEDLVQPTTTPSNGNTAGDWDKITLSWDIMAKTPDQLTVDYSYFNGPRIEWYALTGNRAEVIEGQYICHGTHYYYSGLRFKNSQSPGGMTHSQGKDGFLYDQPCILSFDLTTRKWKVVLDYLKVSANPQEEPTIVPGTRPDPNSMLLLPGPQIHVHGLGQSDNSWFLVGKDGLTNASLPKRVSLVAYGNELLFTDPRGDSDVAPPLMALNLHDIAPFFPKFLPALNEGSSNDPLGLGIGLAEPKLNLRWSLDQNSMTVCNQDLYGIARLVTTSLPIGKPPETIQKSGLAHFDGKRWQILPAGLSRLLPDQSSYRVEMSRDYDGGDGPFSSGKLVLGGYVTDKPLLRRYVPVARWGTN